MISGFATSEGTKKFAQNSGVNQANFKEFEKLSLSNVGIVVDTTNRVIVENFQTLAQPHVYAVGDVVATSPELAPVASHAEIGRAHV